MTNSVHHFDYTSHCRVVIYSHSLKKRTMAECAVHSLGAGFQDVPDQPGIRLKLGLAVSLYIPTAINKSSALTKKRKRSCICDFNRPVISLSNHFIQTKWNDWTGYLSVYLHTCIPALALTLHSERMTRVFHTARRLKLVNLSYKNGREKKERQKEKRLQLIKFAHITPQIICWEAHTLIHTLIQMPTVILIRH